MKNNQQLTVKLQKSLEEIQKAGSLSEISFAKEVLSFSKIRALDQNELSFLLPTVFVRVSNLLGIKEAISDLNKQDIKEMLLMRFSNLSVEEISYAFKLERFGLLGERTEHFQLFNSEYISKVLGKYKKWLIKIRKDNNLPIALDKQKEPKISEQEKQVILEHGIITCFDSYVQKNTFDEELIVTHYHDYLHEKDLLVFTDEEKKQMWVKSKINSKIPFSELLDREKYKRAVSEFQESDKARREVEYKKNRLSRYFDKLIAKSEHVKDKI